MRWNAPGIRKLLLFLTVLLCNVYLISAIDAITLQVNCFPYELAFSHFRDADLTDTTLERFLNASEGDSDSFYELLAMYYGTDNTCTDVELLEQDILFVKKYQPEKFFRLKQYIETAWCDALIFPVGEVANMPSATVSFANTWKQGRNFGGERVHEGTDIMASENVRGIYPVYSVSDGMVENIGWLKLGGYRIGIRSNAGAYFYYAHLSEYAEEFTPGDKVSAGTLLGYMGDTGYSEVEGTTGNFPVHLHFGIYLNDEKGNEFSINSFPLLQQLWKQQHQAAEDNKGKDAYDLE